MIPINEILEDPNIVEIQTGIANLIFTLLQILSEKGYSSKESITIVKQWMESSIIETFNQTLK